METNESATRDYLDKMGAGLKQRGVNVEAAVGYSSSADENAAEQIIKFAGEIRVDVITVLAHVRSYNGRWLFSSVAERLLNKGNTSFLVVRAP